MVGSKNRKSSLVAEKISKIYGNKNVVGVRILECIAEKNQYNSKVKIQFANKGIKESTEAKIIFKNDTKQLFLRKIDDDSGERPIPLGWGPWEDATAEKIISDMKNCIDKVRP